MCWNPFYDTFADGHFKIIFFIYLIYTLKIFLEKI